MTPAPITPTRNPRLASVFAYVTDALELILSTPTDFAAQSPGGSPRAALIPIVSEPRLYPFVFGAFFCANRCRLVRTLYHAATHVANVIRRFRTRFDSKN